MSENKLRKNPSRETCESVISRILQTELAERGRNEHFRQSSDFMPYFESLYPASDALTKQVQRAVKSMGLPKDERGYFIINKTERQLAQETQLRGLLSQMETASIPITDCEKLIFKVPPESIEFLLHLIFSCETFQDKFVTAIRACNGILFYTHNAEELKKLLDSFIR